MEARKLFSRLGWALVAQMAAMLAVQAAMLLAAPLRRALSANLTHRRAERWALRIFAPCAALGAVLLFQHYFIGPIATIPG